MSGHGHSHDNVAPPAAIKGAAALILLSLLLVATARVGLWQPALPAAEQRIEAGLKPVSERMLHFADREDGYVLVTDAASGAQVAALGREGSGFVRGVMRGLARERRQYGAGAQPPFRLAQWPDGALSLTDTATGRVVELNGFGHTNRAVFAGFLAKGGA
jgi:putative photosynthetic complex assembly protein